MKRRLWIPLVLVATVGVALVVQLVVFRDTPTGTPTAEPDSNGVPSQSVDWVKHEIDKGALVLDVRKDDEWAAGRVPDSVHIPLAQVQDRFGELPKGREIITVCKDGGRSYKAAFALRQEGYNAVNLAAGLTAWAAAGLPVVTEVGAPGQIL